MIATTTNTYHNLSEVKRCQNYTASVTAFSSEYRGITVIATQRTPGGTCTRNLYLSSKFCTLLEHLHDTQGFIVKPCVML